MRFMSTVPIENDITVRATFFHLDGDQSRGLAVPQLQIVHLHQVFGLNPTQRFPAFRFFGMTRFDEFQMDLVKFHSVSGQLVVLLAERFAKCHPR